MVKGTTELTKTHRGLEKLNLYRSDLCSLHICNGYVACYSCGSPNSETRGTSCSFACFWDPFPAAGLLAQHWYEGV